MNSAEYVRKILSEVENFCDLGRTHIQCRTHSSLIRESSVKTECGLCGSRIRLMFWSQNFWEFSLLNLFQWFFSFYISLDSSKRWFWVPSAFLYWLSIVYLKTVLNFTHIAASNYCNTNRPRRVGSKTIDKSIAEDSCWWNLSLCFTTHKNLTLRGSSEVDMLSGTCQNWYLHDGLIDIFNCWLW